MARTIHCSIVTPSETVLDDDITYASFPAWDGQHGVMMGQSPQLVELGIGSLRLDFPEGGSRAYLVEGGFAHVQNDTLTILTDHATSAESISLSSAEAELAEANARVTQSAEDRETVNRAQQRALAKMALARASSSRGGAI